ncbi:hypothetical protein X943_000147 [Babesia divergens]|uniref:Uncharacterized protein n=1 Tax=Babesia divergens TaxID=32595 RepID=A0AAD9GE83_BABDI|nr:hypothetical protein X943_000147 [Babesia divergens]
MSGLRLRGFCHLLASSRCSRPFSTSRKYRPNVVNLCLNPPRGKRFPIVPFFFTVGCFLVATPLIAMHYDNKRFSAEMERRQQENIRY